MSNNVRKMLGNHGGKNIAQKINIVKTPKDDNTIMQSCKDIRGHFVELGRCSTTLYM
jgi:hypothetical protein